MEAEKKGSEPGPIVKISSWLRIWEMWFAVISLGLFIPTVLSSAKYLTVIFCGLLAAVCLVVIVLGSRRAKCRRKLYSEAKNADGRVCFVCAYVLVGLPAEGKCPECGTHYAFMELRELWRIDTEM